MGSRLAITEKRPTKNRSFGSVFFHFFDWNRMLSKKKKKSFSNNKLLLLPSVSKKFDGDEKRPKSKHFLIADDNLEDSPTSWQQTDLNNQMRDPGPIAKLMGLESMPIVHPKTHSKPSLVSEFLGNRYETSEVKESRPQKLQRTGGFLERRQEKPVDSSSEALHFNKRVRRLQHHKLASPLKSPRLLSKRSTSRLIEAATKVLEPGLHQRKSTKYALTYANSLHSDEKVTVDGIFMKKNNISSDNYVMANSKSSSSLDGSVELSRNEKNNMKVKYVENGTSSIFSQDKIVAKRSLVILSGQKDRPMALDASKMNVESSSHGLLEKKKYMQEDHDRKNSIQNQLPTIARKLDYNSNRGTHSTLSTKNLGRERVEIARNMLERKNKTLKRRPNDDLQSENAKVVSFTFEKQQSVRNDATIGKGKGVSCKRSVYRNSVNSELKNHIKVNSASGLERNEIVSFSFSSPMRHDSRSYSNESMVDKRTVGKLGCNASRQKKLISDKKIHSIVSQRQGNVRGDSLSTLLEQNVGELKSLETMYSGSTNNSDLTVISPNVMVKTNGKSKIEAEVDISSAASDGDHPSPMSILEVSFSIDGCFSGSPYDTSVHNPDDTCINIQSLDLDTDLQDSASSFDSEKLDIQKPTDSLGKTSVGGDVNLYELWFSECNLSMEAKLNAELLVECISSPQSTKKDSFVFDTLESITTALGVADAKDEHQLERLLFHCVIECLDSQCNLLNTGPKIPLLTIRERLKRAVCEEVEGWNGLIGKGMNDLVEKDVRHSSMMWTEFKIEAFETCVQIENDLLQELVGELATNLCS